MSVGKRRAWGIVASLFVLLLLVFGGAFLTFTVFFQPLVKSFGWSHAEVSLLVTVLLVVSAVLSPLAGWLLERIPAQIEIAIGAAAVASGFIIASRATSYGMMLTAYAVLGVGVGLATMVPTQVVIASWFEHRKRGAAISVAVAGGATGGVVMVIAVAHTVAAWGWRAAYVLLAIPVLVLLIPLVLIVVRVRPAACEGEAAAHSAETLSGLEIGEALGTHSFWITMLLYFASGFATAITFAHSVPILIGFGYTLASAASVVEEYQVVTVVGTILMGVLGDRIGGRGALSVCFVGIALSFLALMRAAVPAWRILFILTFGFNAGAPVGLLAILMIHTLGLKRFGFFSGLGGFLFSFGLAAGPFAAGRIFDLTGSYNGALEMGGLLSLAMAILVTAVTVPRHQGEAVAAECEKDARSFTPRL